jgi:glutathione peroxidase
MSDLQDIPLETITGEQASLGSYRGKVLLVVNVASKCGLTPQYEALEALHERYADRGFSVLGFPANDFLGQEPGTNEEIAEFCSTSFGVTFPLFSKISVAGERQHPLYRALTNAVPHAEGDPEAMRSRLVAGGIPANDEPDVLWNFEKFLISRDGSVARRFAPNLAPDAPELVAAVEQELKLTSPE